MSLQFSFIDSNTNSESKISKQLLNKTRKKSSSKISEDRIKRIQEKLTYDSDSDSENDQLPSDPKQYMLTKPNMKNMPDYPKITKFKENAKNNIHKEIKYNDDISIPYQSNKADNKEIDNYVPKPTKYDEEDTYEHQFNKPFMGDTIQFPNQSSLPYSSSPSPSSSSTPYSNNDILNKLNYVIHMIEEQQNKKSDNVVEELILYSFLGMFIIFLVDSFVRVGRYTRK